MPAPYSWSFTTTSFAPCPCTVFAPSATPADAGHDRHALGRARAEVPGRRERLHHRRPLLQGRDQHRRPHGNAVVVDGHSSSRPPRSRTSRPRVGSRSTSRRGSPVTANTTYVVSYHTQRRSLLEQLRTRSRAASTTPPLHALANGVDGPNGVFSLRDRARRSRRRAATTSTTGSTPSTSSPTRRPSVTTTDARERRDRRRRPRPTVTATFGKAVAGLVGPDRARRRARGGGARDVLVRLAQRTRSTLTPTTPLNQSTAYTATVNGVTDSAGVPMAAPYSWSFTTASSPSCPCSIFSPTATPGRRGHRRQGGRARREVPVRHRRLRQVGALLQGRDEHRRARRQPVVLDRNPPRDRDVRERDGRRVGSRSTSPRRC